MLLHLTPILTLLASVAAFGTAAFPKQTQLEKRVELQGIYRIQNPQDGTVLAVGEEVTGKPPLSLLVTKAKEEGALEQEWNIVTTGPPVARVAAIFNEKVMDNVLTNEFGFPGTKFTRAWQFLDAGSDMVILRNLGLCLTRAEGKVERSECSHGRDASDSQKWKMVFVREIKKDE